MFSGGTVVELLFSGKVPSGVGHRTVGGGSGWLWCGGSDVGVCVVWVVVEEEWA